MSNLTPQDVDTRLTETRNEFSEEHVRLWEGLATERVSRIAGDDANLQLIGDTQDSLAASESRLSIEVVQREQGDLRNITSLTELAQALSDYRIKTDLELNQERIARTQFGVDFNNKVDTYTASFNHQYFLMYQAIADVQSDVDSKYTSLDIRVARYEQMLSDITMDSIQITMDNGDINMGAWTILSQAREWDLEILGKFKDYQTITNANINEALEEIQDLLPVEQNIVDKAIEALSNSPIILELDAKLNQNINDINDVQSALQNEAVNRQNEMIGLAQNNATTIQGFHDQLATEIQTEAQNRATALSREAAIRQQQLIDEAAERTAEIDEKLYDALGNLNVDLSGVYNEINQVSAALDVEEAARVAAITNLNDGLTQEIQLRQDGDTANLAVINNYKTSNDAALANVRSELQANVTATTANASNITALDTRLGANESLAASAVNKAETALTQNSAMAADITSVKASITGIEGSLVNKADASALQLLDSKVTVIDGKVTTNTSDITQLKTKVTTLTNTKADATALNALTSTVTTQGNTITSQSKNISDLTAAISTSVPEIKFTGTQDCINITAAFATNPDVTLITEPSAVSGKVVRIGNNAGTDQFQGIMHSYVAIDPTKLYRVKYRVRRVLNDAAGMFLSLVQTNATKTLNVKSSNMTLPITDISSSLFYLINAKPTLDTWLTGEYYFKGKSAGASSGSGTVASPRTFSADAAFFRIGILSNFPAASGTQDVDYIIVEDYDAMALGNANATATTALTARVTSAEGTLTSNSTAITQLQNNLATTNNTVANKADASVVSALDSKVTTMGSNVTSNSSAITQLQNNLTATNAVVNTKASAAALTALDTKVTTVDGKVTTQGTQITTLNNSLTVTDKLTRLQSQGKPAFNDPMFSLTTNGLVAYGAQTGYTLARQTKSTDNPVASTHEYKMSMTQVIAGNGIGFCPYAVGVLTAANKILLFKIVAKAPVGASMSIWRNAAGDNPVYEILGNNKGTGKYEPYYFWCQAGSTGTFSTVGHVTFTQGTSTVGTVETPWEAFIGSYEVWDVTTVDDSIPKIWADKVDASATAVTSLNSQVTAINGTVTSQGSQLTTLTNRVSTVEGSVANKADSSVVSSLDSKVTTIDGKVTQNANAITTLTGRVTTVENGLTNKADSSVLVNYSTKTETNTAIATGIQNYNASLVIGGVNVLLNSEAARTSVVASYEEYLMYERSAELKAFYDDNLGKPITISFEMNVPVAGSVTVYSSNFSAHIFFVTVVATEVDKFVKYTVTVTPAAHPTTPTATQSSLEFYGTYGTGCIPTIRKAQVEAGTKATAWSPSPRDVTAALNANASAISTTQASVTALDGRVTTNASDVTLLKTRVTTVEGSLTTKADNSALQSLDSRVTTAEGSITSQGSSITKLTNDLSVSATAGENLLMKSNVVGLYDGIKYPHNSYKLYENFVNGDTYTLIWCAEHKQGAGDTNSYLAAYVAGGSEAVDSLNGGSAGSGKVIRYKTFVKGSSTVQPDTVNFYMINRPTADKASVGTVYWAVLVRGSITTTKQWIPSKFDLLSDVQANATGLTSLTNTVTAIDGRVTTNSSNITSLTGRVTTAEGKITANTAAVTTLDTRVTATESGMTTQATNITKLSARVDSSSGVGLNLDYLCVNNESWYEHYTSNSPAASMFNNAIADGPIGDKGYMQVGGTLFIYNKTALPTNKTYRVQFWAKRSADSNGTGSFITIARRAPGQAFNVTNYAYQWIPVPKNDTWYYVDQVINLTAATTTYPLMHLGFSVNNGGTLGTTQVQGFKITEVLDYKDTTGLATSDALTALTTRTTTLEGTVNTQATQITSLNSSLSGKADASAVTSLTTRVTAAEGNITNLSTQTTNLSNRITSAEGSIVANTNALNTLNTKVTTIDGKVTANTNSITSLNSAITGKADAAALNSLSTQVTNIDGRVTANATSLTQLQTKVGNNTAAIAVQGTTINGIKAEYTIKLDVNGLVSGIGLINNGTTTAIGMNADYFYVGSTSAGKKPFMVLTSQQTIGGVTYPAGTWMDVALIANATIGSAHIKDAAITNAKIASLDAGKITTGFLDAARIQANTITADKISVTELSAITGTIGVLRTATSGSRMEIRDNVIKCYDGNVLRVQLGNLSL